FALDWSSDVCSSDLINRGHFAEADIEGAGALAHGDDDIRYLVDGHGADRGGFVEAEPDIGEDDDDQRRQVEEEDEPGIEEGVGPPADAEENAEDRADHHGHHIGGNNPCQCHGEMVEKFAARSLRDQRTPHGSGGWKGATWPDLRRHMPEQAQTEK